MFRTIEISDPQFEFANLRFITVKTANLKGRGNICIYLPEPQHLQTQGLAKDLNTVKETIPLVILLHGVYGSCWSWALKAGVHITANQMIKDGTIRPMAIAMPSDGLQGDGSGYLSHGSSHVEKWIVEDVPLAVSEASPIITKTSPLFISGLSMGGFGALRLGVKYQEKFKGISAHSSITGLGQMAFFIEEPINNLRQALQEDESVWGTIQSKNGAIPPLRFDCGSEDILIRHNRKLHRQLNEAKIDHLYQEFPGGHEWPYWQEHIKKSLLFFDGLL